MKRITVMLFLLMIQCVFDTGNASSDSVFVFEKNIQPLHIMTLEEEINRQPVEWAWRWTEGASSNNWALLKRVMRVEDAEERIRLVNLLYRHMRTAPSAIVADIENYKLLWQSIQFSMSCATHLIRDKSSDPLVILAGWRLRSNCLDDVEELGTLTKDVDFSNPPIPKLGFSRSKNEMDKARMLRWRYEVAKLAKIETESYFGHGFATCVYFSYEHLPDEWKPVFIQQIKKDFFHRDGMKHVDRTKLPKEFQEEATR